MWVSVHIGRYTRHNKFISGNLFHKLTSQTGTTEGQENAIILFGYQDDLKVSQHERPLRLRLLVLEREKKHLVFLAIFNKEKRKRL